MEIRKSTYNDTSEILNIFEIAKSYMRTHGNATQWTDGYPGEEILKKDVASGNSYVVTDRGSIVATFTFIIGEESTYQIIKNGNWSYAKPYGTIHRLASNGKTKGISRVCFDFCIKRIDYIRIDTHQDNISMQAAIEKYGFQKCGNIYVQNGSERIAYDYFYHGADS